MNFDRITPVLYLGQKIDSQELHDALVQEGITHVINLWSGNPEPIWQGPVLTLKQEDDRTPRPINQTLLGVEYAWHTQKLYVHCQWGLGRAPSMTYAILRSRGLTKDQAVDLIVTSRPKCKGNWEHYIDSIEEGLCLIE